MNAASPAWRRTAACSALPPSRMYKRGVEKSTPRSTNSLNSELITAVRGAFADPQHRFASIAANLKGRNDLPVFERSAVDQHGAQPQLAQRTLHQLLHLLAAGLDEVLAHRRLLDSISGLEVL